MCIMNKVKDVQASKHWGEREKLLAVAVCKSRAGVCMSVFLPAGSHSFNIAD